MQQGAAAFTRIPPIGAENEDEEGDGLEGSASNLEVSRLFFDKHIPQVHVNLLSDLLSAKSMLFFYLLSILSRIQKKNYLQSNLVRNYLKNYCTL